MHTKVRIGMGTSAVLVASLIGAGSLAHVPKAYAAEIQSTAPASTTENKQTAGLSKLEIAGVQLDQTFSSDLKTYTATVDNNIQQVYLNLESVNPQATILVNNQNITNGTAGPFDLKTGSNVFTITVKNPDSSQASTTGTASTTDTTSSTGTTNTTDTTNTSDTTSTSNTTSTSDTTSNTDPTYTLTINRKPPSSNNLLNGVNFSIGKLETNFEQQNTNYNLILPNNAKSITVTPQIADKTAVATVNGNPLNSDGNIVIPLPVKQIEIDVKAENGETKPYIFKVVQLPVTTPGNPGPNPGVPTGKPGSHPGKPIGKPGSHPGTSTGKPGSKPGASNSKSGLKTGSKSKYGSGKSSAGSSVKGSKTAGNSGFKTGTGSTHGASGQQNGSFAPKPSTALLASLGVSSGTWNKAFDPNAFTYHFAIASNVAAVTIDPGAKYSDATVSINGGNENIVQLSGIKTIIPLVVTRGDEHKTYVLVFDKPVPPVTAAPVAAADTTNAANVTSSSDNSSGMDAFSNDSASSSGTENNSSQGFWSRLIDSIKAFFSKIL